MRRRIPFVMLLVTAIVLGAEPAYARALGLDASFGSGGYLVTPYGSAAEAVDAVRAPGGSVLLLGEVNGGEDAAIVKLTPDGHRVRAFGNQGRALVDLGANDQPAAIAIDGAGRILVAGSLAGSGVVARFDPSGAPDPSFGEDGVARIHLEAHLVRLHGIAITGSNRVVVAGAATAGTRSRFLVVRLTTAGSLDPSFSSNGMAAFGFGGRVARAADVALDGGGVVVAGTARAGHGDDAAVARVRAGGTLDPGFGRTGRVLAGSPSVPDEITSLTIRTDGRIVLAGSVGFDMRAGALFAFRGNGSRDRSFSGDGWLRLDLVRGAERFLDVAAIGGGRLVAVGQAGGDLLIVGVRADASVVWRTLDFGGRVDRANAVIVPPSGRPIAVGRFTRTANLPGAPVLPQLGAARFQSF